MVDQKEDTQELIHQTTKKKYRSRQQRVCTCPLVANLIIDIYIVLLQKFSNRSAVVAKAEDKYWKQLDINYMTEESDDPSDNMIIVEHIPAWCSQSEFNKQL